MHYSTKWILPFPLSEEILRRYNMDIAVNRYSLAHHTLYTISSRSLLKVNQRLVHIEI